MVEIIKCNYYLYSLGYLFFKFFSLNPLTKMSQFRKGLKHFLGKVVFNKLKILVLKKIVNFIRKKFNLKVVFDIMVETQI